MSRLDCALRELESATAAVGSVPVEDFAEARAAMDRRAWAIADLAAMVAEGVAVPEQAREQILSRLRRALEAGRVAEQRLVRLLDSGHVADPDRLPAALCDRDAGQVSRRDDDA